MGRGVGMLLGPSDQGILADAEISEGSWDALSGVGSQDVTG